MDKLIALIGTSDSKLLSTEMAGGFRASPSAPTAAPAKPRSRALTTKSNN